jgi:anti-sigma factor RsiW
MSGCERFDRRLDDFVDGLLKDRPAGEVSAHLEACAACRDAVSAIRSLKEEAAGLPDHLRPGRDLWPAIAGKLDAGRAGLLAFRRGGGRGARLGWAAGLAAAAGILVAVTASITALLMRGGPEPPAPRQAAAGAAVLAAYRSAEVEYLRAADELRAALEQRRGDLAPGTVALLEENLLVIDRAIKDMWTALEEDPGRGGNPHLFNALYQKKVMLLRQAVRLPSQGWRSQL